MLLGWGYSVAHPVLQHQPRRFDETQCRRTVQHGHTVPVGRAQGLKALRLLLAAALEAELHHALSERGRRPVQDTRGVL
jgi:hypothetical protein